MISRKDKLRRTFTSLEILDRLKSGDKLTSLCEKFNRNESTIRTFGKNESKTRASAGDLLLTNTENCLIIWIEDCNRKNIPLNIYLIFI